MDKSILHSTVLTILTVLDKIRLHITVLIFFDNNGQNSVTQYNANNFLQHCVTQYGADICFANGKKSHYVVQHK